MKRYIFILIALFYLCLCKIYGQDNLKEFATSIIDSSNSQTDQAKSIYDWITRNISYDVKSYLKITPKDHTPAETIKSKKGLCFEYANLMTALCNSAGIEAYTIFGYTKGIDHYPEKIFLHSNHCWNILRADSNWIIADPTWGSGYIENKTRTWSRLLKFVGFKPVMKQKQIFIKEYNPTFFNISSIRLLNTHYPLDPKWLFENQPPSYKAFESDFHDSILINVNWKAEINEVINKSQEYGFLYDGETAYNYNSNNLFDWGMALYQTTLNIDFQQPISNENFDRFINVNERLEKAILLLSKQQHITDSVYKIRQSDLNNFHINHSGSDKTIKKEAENAKNNYQKDIKVNFKKTQGIYKKIAAYNAKIRNLQETHLKEKRMSVTPSKGKQKDGEIIIELADNEMEQWLYKPRLDSLTDIMRQLLTNDAILNDSILELFYKLNDEIINLNHMIVSGNEILINSQSDSVWNKFTTCFYLIDRKNKNSNHIIHISQLFKENKSKWEELLNRQQTQLKEFYKTYKLPDAIYDIYAHSLSENIQLYKNQIYFENKLLAHYELQEGFIVASHQILKKLDKSAKNEFRQFNQWYTKKIEWERLVYKRDKQILSKTIYDATQNKKIIGKKIIAFNQ